MKIEVVTKINTKKLIKDNVERFENPGTSGTSTGRKPVGNKTQAIGSAGEVYHDGYDKGFLSTVLNAYANHWDLVTSPEDWWFTILRTIAVAIDKHSTEKKVRDFFVSHEGRKELVVIVPSLEQTDFSWFFNQMTDQVADNLNKPEYVNLARPGFSTTTKDQEMVANIAIMSSVQEYFEYTLGIECGIPRVEMMGELEDWEKLRAKFDDMRNLLKDIKPIILPDDKWWNGVNKVLDKLVLTYNDTMETKPEIQEWWKQVIDQQWGCGGPPSFTGWFVHDLLGTYVEAAPLGIITVPLTIDDNGNREQAAVVAGIAGFNVNEDTSTNRTTIQSNNVWGLMMLPDSGLRKNLV